MSKSPHRMLTRTAVAVSGAALAAAGLAALAVSPAQAANGVPRYDHVVLVMEENHSYSEIIGPSTGAPYINNTLAAGGALFTQSFAIEHPSEPNYLDLFSGSNQGITTDQCPVAIDKPNEGAQLLTAGDTWDSYSEGLPSAGSTACTSGSYASKHSPWVNFQLAPSTSANHIPATSNLPFTSFPSSANYASLPTVSWVVPNLLDDMHDGTITQGDTWLQTNIDAYAQWAKTHNSLLIVTWDEDDSSMSNQIPTIFYGAGVKTGQFSEHINHYNVLRTIEDVYGLPYAGNAANSTPITDVWSAGTGDIVSVTNPGTQTTTVGSAASLQIQASDSAAGQTLAYSAAGLPAGLSINTSTGLISGTPTASGSSNVTVTVTDTTGASGTANFVWNVNPVITGGITNGGFETGTLSGWTATGTTAVVNTGAHSGTYAAKLGSTGPTSTSSLAQTFTAPSGAGTLTFWYNVACTDTLKHDWATATLTDNTSATTTTVLAKTCTSGAGWRSASAPVTVGHSYTLTLTNRDDNRSGDPGITTLFDDVTLA